MQYFTERVKKFSAWNDARNERKAEHYRDTGLEKWLIDKPSKLLGSIFSARNKVSVQEAYMLGAVMEIIGIQYLFHGDMRDAFMSGIAGFGVMVVGAAHHYSCNWYERKRD